jgi:hypothetical protein
MPGCPSSRLYGLRRFRANHFLGPVNNEDMKMNDTCGPFSTSLSNSADLQRSLGSKLRARLEGNGSPLYALTWRHWDMLSGPPICALRARAHPTSGNGSSGAQSGRPTPNTPSGGPNVKSTDKHTGGMDLDGAVTLVGWPTATTRDWKSSASNLHGANARPPNEVARLAGWPTTRSADGEKNVRTAEGAQREMERKGGPQGLNQAATLAPGTTSSTSPAPTAKRGQLNPAFSRWLMAYPKVWCVAAIEAWHSTPTTRRKRG